jgi:hypothetical protein
MRALVAFALVIAANGQAPAQPLTSKPMERALELYDKRDYFFAHAELHKVATGAYGDSLPVRQKARFFAAKALYNLKLFVAAAAEFEHIRADRMQSYQDASLRWQVALTYKLPPHAVIPALVAFTEADIAHPTLAKEANLVRMLRGFHHLMRGDHGRALVEVSHIKPGTPAYSNAQLIAGMAHLRSGDAQAALAAFGRVPATSEEAAMAHMAAGQQLMRQQQYKAAIAEYKQVRSGPLEARAAWELSWACMHDRGKGDALRSLRDLAATPLLDPFAADSSLLQEVLAFDLCATTQKRSADALAGFRTAAPGLQRELSALVKNASDDDAEFFELVVRRLAAGEALGLSRRAQSLVHATLSTFAVSEQLALLEEIERELDIVRGADQSWQSTAAAGEALTELTLQYAVASAALGKLARDRIQRLGQEVTALAHAATGLQPVVALPGRGDGLTVRCR